MQRRDGSLLNDLTRHNSTFFSLCSFTFSNFELTECYVSKRLSLSASPTNGFVGLKSSIDVFDPSSPKSQLSRCKDTK